MGSLFRWDRASAWRQRPALAKWRVYVGAIVANGSTGRRFRLPRKLAAMKAGWVAAAAAVGGRGGGGGGDMGGGMPQVRRLSKTEMLFEKLKLNKEQKEEAATIISAAMEKAAPTSDLLNKGRMLSPTPSLAREATTTSRSFWASTPRSARP